MQIKTIQVSQKIYPVLELVGRPKAILDRTLADIYQVKTEHINQALSRNTKKFPDDFCFELTKEEFQEVITNCGHLYNIKYSRYLPKAYTHAGCNMMATILRSEVAIRRSIEIVRAFTEMESVGLGSRDEEWDIITAKIIAAINNKMEDMRFSFQREIYSLQQKVVLLEDQIQDLTKHFQLPDLTQKISVSQIAAIREAAQQKVDSRSEVMQLWKSFKKMFSVKRYCDLPEIKFQEALQWIDSWDKNVRN